MITSRKNPSLVIFPSNTTGAPEGNVSVTVISSSPEKEGHFSKGKQQKWWLFYDKTGAINHKCQLKDNKKNGYCLLYTKGKLEKASKFIGGKKIKEWTDLSSFKKENSLLDLR